MRDVVNALNNNGIVIFEGRNNIKRVACGKYALSIGVDAIFWDYVRVVEIANCAKSGIELATIMKNELKTLKNNKTNKSTMSDLQRYLDTVGKSV